MNSLFRKIFLLILPVFMMMSAHNAHAQLKNDTARIQIRTIPDASIKKYKNDEAFNYNEQRAKGTSFWSRLWDRIFGVIDRAYANKFWGPFFEVLLWILVFGALLYAVLKLSGMEKLGFFSKNRTASKALDYLVTEEDIYAIDFTESIALAINEKNFRLAIRLLYLQTLRKLADNELISWKLNKTNDVYIRELSGTAYSNDFNYITYAYDYAWYGEVPVNEEQFSEVHPHFMNFQKKLPA
ncbi:MAG: hypothetical protein H7Y27_03895 [Gemmatimonadaceae bacterium]|nr:hypothetical protein [Chitinophagaceae bacterium]